MQRVLGRAVALLLLCDLAVVGVRALGPEPTVRTVAAPAPASAPGTAPLPPGQARVTGRVTALAADADVLDTIAPPFTVDLPERGAGGATIDGARVGGEAAAIVWDGGRPLTLTGDAPGLDPSPAHVEVDPAAITIALGDGTARALTPGTYRLAAPVAVGSGGLATPRDRVTFTADAATTLTATGGARVRVARRPFRLDGPGSVRITGALEVRTADGVRPASTVVFGPGAFEVSLRPATGGWDLEATLQGPLTLR